jgi:hypothetical protein
MTIPPLHIQCVNVQYICHCKDIFDSVVTDIEVLYAQTIIHWCMNSVIFSYFLSFLTEPYKKILLSIPSQVPEI